MSCAGVIVRHLNLTAFKHEADLPDTPCAARPGAADSESRYFGQAISASQAARDLNQRAEVEEGRRSDAARLRNILDMIPQMVWSMKADGSEHYYNEQWTEFTGVRLNEDREARLALVHPDDRENAKLVWEQAILGTNTYDLEYRILHRSGEYRWVHSRARREKPVNGETVCWYGVVSDIHDRKCSELALAQSELLHRSILEASSDCIKVLGKDGRLELMNGPGACALEIDNVEDVLGCDWLSFWPAEARNTVMAALAEAQAGNPARFTGNCFTAKGTERWWDVIITPMTDHIGEVTRLLCISRDITSIREASDKLRWNSEHDALTDLPNRRLFHTHLQAATIRSMESGDQVGLLIIDLDHFKHINDTLGHAAGDFLLKAFGQRLKSSVRTTDMVARLGGDEFAIILEGVQAEADVVRVGRSISQCLEAPVLFDGAMITTSASVGGALFPTDASCAHELFKSADSALYSLKDSGRGGTKMFQGYMREEAQKTASQLSLARVALTEKNLVPHYQQKVDLKTGQIRGFEALLRWYHPEKGIQLPDTVAEAFKDYELASKIGELMQEHVFADMSCWVRDGVPFGRVAINASPAEFLRNDYAEKLLARLAVHGLQGNCVEVEVTEQVFLDRGAEYVSRALKLLNAAGVRLSLDDFGTGYSSLSHLRDFPVDVVKIDRSFIQEMAAKQEMASIVAAVVNLAGSLSIDVVAEGVELPEQAAILRELGCGVGQGYLFGGAVVAGEVRKLF